MRRHQAMLELRRGTVVAADGPRLEVDLGDERAPAWADLALVGPCLLGDEVVVNVQARRLGLGSGGFDVVHVNLSRGLDGTGAPGAHVMKLGYTSLQHAVAPVEAEGPPDRPLAGAVAVLLLHGQLAPLAWAHARAAPGRTLGFVQAAGGALPGALSDDVRLLRARGLLAGHVTAAPAYGGEEEAITLAGALDAGLRGRGWDAVVVGPGPGILGSATALGHGGLAALDALHAALALGLRPLLAPRLSATDPRPRHRGLSHHTRTVLDLVLAPVVVALPEGAAPGDPRHDWRPAPADLAAYATSGLPLRTMGREDPLFFAAALAAGRVLAGL